MPPEVSSRAVARGDPTGFSRTAAAPGMPTARRQPGPPTTETQP